MRRLFRWAFNGIVLVSALLVVATCLLWVRSYHQVDAVNLARHAIWSLGSYDGELWAKRTRFGWKSTDAVVNQFDEVSSYSDLWSIVLNHSINGPRARFLAEDQTKSYVSRYFGESRLNGAGSLIMFSYADTRYVAIPDWSVALLAILLPLAKLVKLSCRRRLMAGHCRACGYDLRATPGRCPECGAVPAGKAAS